MLPLLMTLPVAPTLLQMFRPASKSSCFMLSVVATRPPTSMLAPGAKYTPVGLLRKTWPLADRRPKNWTGLSTRYSALPPVGWAMMTEALALVLKVVKLTAELSVDWSAFSVVALGYEKVVAPDFTFMPVGRTTACPYTICGSAKAALTERA